MIDFPIYNLFYIKFDDKYLDEQTWYPNKNKKLNSKVIADPYALMPSMENNILYVDIIEGRYYTPVKNDTGEKNYIINTKLSIKSNDVEILLDDIMIDIIVDQNVNYQNIIYSDNKTPLFKLSNLKENKQIDITFKMTNTDSYDRKFINTAYFQFYYNASPKKGDVNGDGSVDMKDLIALANHVSIVEEISFLEAGDLTGNGNISIIDVIKLGNYILSK